MQEILSEVDARIEAIWPSLVAAQEAYAATHNGRFFQGLWTHSDPPDDGELEPADKLTNEPSDQPVDWTEFGLSTWREKFSVRIDVYASPLGHGWVGGAEIRFGGRIYQRWRGVGPENRDRDWHEVLSWP